VKICDLRDGWSLHARADGVPYRVSPFGREWVVTRDDFYKEENVRRVEAWMADPNNDCLRARGDARWQAASAAAMIWKSGLE
jgi:hypothetical protein